MALSNFSVVNLIIRKANDDTDLTASKYAQLFAEFSRSETTGQSSKEKECLIITNAKYTTGKGETAFFGQFVEYTKLDKRKWFNLLKKDVDEDFAIPDHLKANSNKNIYFFIPSIHRFCYSFKSNERISPIHVEAFLNNALTKFLDENYPDQYYPEINFEKEKETINEIISAESILSLDIKVTYSNDFGKKMKEFFEEDIKNGNADDVQIIARNKNGESLNLEGSQMLRGALEATASHGVASASIKNGKRRRTIKTVDHPAKYRLKVAAIPEYLNDIVSYFKKLFNND